MEDILIILAAVAFSIISAIGNKKKKQRIPPPTAPTEFEDPYDMDRPAPLGREQIILEEYIDAAPDKDTVNMLREYEQLQRSKTKPGRENRTKNPKPERAALEPQPEENRNILEDFDLRKAVIYSEILKPKFKQ